MSEQPNWPLLAALRFFLALTVFNVHIALVGGNTFLGKHFGASAVAAFFVISGFSMAHSLSRNPKVGTFYERRFYRIWPMFILATGLSLVPMLRGEGFYVWPYGPMAELPSQRHFLINALMMVPLLGGCIPTNLTSWTLSLEVAFYLFVPLYSRLPDRARFALLAASLALMLSFGTTGPLIQDVGFVWPYLGFFWLFGMGFELFQHRAQMQFQTGALAAAMTGGAGGVTMALSLLLIFNQDRLKMSARMSGIALYLGELSYPLYILGDPVKAIWNQAFPGTPIWGYYVVCGAASVLAYHLLDAPLRGWHGRRREKQKEVLLLSMNF